MNIATLAEAIDAATRFIVLANRLFEQKKKDDDPGFGSASKEAGSVKRASMDLTRALAEMRKPG